MGNVQYTDEQKTEAVRLYLEVGPDEAAAEIGCSRRSVYQWLGLHGVQTKKPDERRAETEARHTEKREILRELLMDQAIDMLHRQNEKHRTWKDGVEIIHEHVDADDCKAYALAAGILIDKYRLEKGEATSRTITEGADDIDRSVVQLVAEMARRGETSAT